MNLLFKILLPGIVLLSLNAVGATDVSNNTEAKCAKKANEVTGELQKVHSNLKAAIDGVARAFRTAQSDEQLQKLDLMCKEKVLLGTKFSEVYRQLAPKGQVTESTDGSIDVTEADSGWRQQLEGHPDVIKFRQLQKSIDIEMTTAWDRAGSRVQSIREKLAENHIQMKFFFLHDLKLKMSKPLERDPDLYSTSTFHEALSYNYCSDEYTISVDALDAKYQTQTYVTPKGLWYWQYHQNYGCPDSTTWGDEFVGKKKLNVRATETQQPALTNR